MGKATDAIKAFIQDIPDEKLVGFSDPNPTYTVYNDKDFRLDVQNMVAGKPPQFNIQVQINAGTSISTLKKMSKKSKNRGTTVAKALIPSDGSFTAADVRNALLEGLMI
ncbi:hypothetical protein KJ359_006635 [Pestalotiopsis sp. 9143b]|nr:hypothetical protein KJ359_006635 [Pestalotiopsis sp. 9143b]